MSRTSIWSACFVMLTAMCVAQVKNDGGDIRIETADDDVRVMVSKGQEALKGYSGAMMLRAMTDDPSKRLDLDIKNEPVREALKDVLSKAKVDHVVDDDVPKDVRVTIVAKNVRLRTALSLIAEAAGIGWRSELEGGKVRFRFGKGIKSWDSVGSVFDAAGIRTLRGLDLLKIEPLKDGVVWRALAGVEERSSMTCPHCKAQITRVGPRENPKCPKCSTEFKSGWKVCPFDGTKRPETPGDWKYCPVCGKGLADKASE